MLVSTNIVVYVIPLLMVLAVIFPFWMLILYPHVTSLLNLHPYKVGPQTIAKLVYYQTSTRAYGR